nr:hypothetical protein [Tanacetum cinerariifolium]
MMSKTWKVWGVFGQGYGRYPFDYRVTLGFGSIACGLDPVSPVIRLSIEHGINSGDDVDISTLTMEQYLALIRDDIRLGVVKPKIGNDVEFEINSNFMMELRRKLFAGEKVKPRTTMGKENMKEPVPRDLPVVQTYVPLTTFLEPFTNSATIYALGLVCNEAKVTVHITPPDDDYLALAINPILNKHLNKFGEEFADNTRVFEKIDSNHVNDLKELLRTYDFETFI